MSENFVQSFQLETSRIRGRIVRLDDVLDDMLGAHKYPDDVLHLTGEMAVLGVLLSSMLKYEGIFTLQTQGDGPVKMLVADVNSEGHVRACASFDKEALADRKWQDNRAELTGSGYIAFTVDQGEHMERYQGIVELKNESLVSGIQHYFTQSEQINTGVMLSIGKVDDAWRGCGIMVQEMPEDTVLYNQDRSNVDEDDWRRTMILLGSVKEQEMLSPELSASDLLLRLFHEEGVRVYEPRPLLNVCRCNTERVQTVLSSMSDEDIAEMTVDGTITMTCEFCSRDYKLDPATIGKGQEQ